MKTVYQLTALGWVRVMRGQSFEHACQLARDLTTANPGTAFCVNS